MGIDAGNFMEESMGLFIFGTFGAGGAVSAMLLHPPVVK